jgi:hypothetical protein
VTFVWFVVWLVANLIADREALRFDPVKLVGRRAPARGRSRPEQAARPWPRLTTTYGLRWLDPAGGLRHTSSPTT